MYHRVRISTGNDGYIDKMNTNTMQHLILDETADYQVDHNNSPIAKTFLHAPVMTPGRHRALAGTGHHL